MENGYSFIFKKIVADDNDFVGMVAYTLYKRQKVEWIEKFSEDHQRAPSDDELDAGFTRFSLMPSQLQIYREQAVDLLDNFLDQALSAKVFEAEMAIRDDAIVNAVKKSTWQGITENIVGGLAASLITVGATIIAWFALKGPESILRDFLGDFLKR